jgi:hypothetical protein
MRNTISKSAIAALTALSLAASAFAVTVEPASAAGPAFHGGGRGGGGWHGGAGGWHGGGGGWHGGGHGGGWHGGGWAGPAIVGGLAAGALLAAPYAYGYGYNGYGYGGCTAYQPMYDAYGNYIGQQLVRTC